MVSKQCCFGKESRPFTRIKAVKRLPALTTTSPPGSSQRCVCDKNWILASPSPFQTTVIRPYCKLEAEKPKTTFPRHFSSSGFPRDLAILAPSKIEWGKRCINPHFGCVLSCNRSFRGVRVRKMAVWFSTLPLNPVRMWEISWPSLHWASASHV